MSIWETLLATAIHAPSPHNVQPWRVRILSDNHAELLIEKRRTLPKEDPTGSFIILTMGLFIEALSILAANRALQLEYDLYQAPSQFTPEHIVAGSSAAAKDLPQAAGPGSYYWNANRALLGAGKRFRDVSMSLVDVGILKSIGPDQKKLENTLEMFGREYRYLVFGYPPFIKSFADTTRLDLKQYQMDLIVGGEGISEPLRSHLLQFVSNCQL